MFRSFYQNISHHKGVEQSNLQLCLNIHLCHYNIGHRSFHIGSSSIWCYKYLQSDRLLVIQCPNNSRLRCLSNLKDLDEKEKNNIKIYVSIYFSLVRVSVQGVKSLSSHFACLCRGFEFYEVKKNVIIFQKENWRILHF